MTDKEKDLPYGFGETKDSVEAEVVKNTGTEIGSILNPQKEKELIASVIDEIKDLNPDMKILDNEVLLFSDNPEKLKLPEGFIFSDINGITNKNIKESGVFVSITVYPLRYHPSYNGK